MATEDSSIKADRRDAARAEAAKLRDAQARREKRNRAITIGVLAIAVIALVGVFLFVLNSGKDADDAGGGTEGTVTDVTTPGTSTAAPATANENDAITVGKSGEAGSTNGANAVVVDLYLDYLCPFCGQLEQTSDVMLSELVASGDVTLAYHPLSTQDHNAADSVYSTRAASAAAYVADQAPEAFKDFSTALFANQPAEGTRGLTNAKMAEIAQAAGVPAATAAKISDGTAMETFGGWVQAATMRAGQDTAVLHEDGKLYTPTILINGERHTGDWRDLDSFKQAILDAKQ